MALFFVAGVAGVYGFGRTFEHAPLWAIVSLAALVVLAKQMGRVQNTWLPKPREGVAAGHAGSGIETKACPEAPIGTRNHRATTRRGEEVEG